MKRNKKFQVDVSWTNGELNNIHGAYPSGDRGKGQALKVLFRNKTPGGEKELWQWRLSRVYGEPGTDSYESAELCLEGWEFQLLVELIAELQAELEGTLEAVKKHFVWQFDDD